ncbi:MAG: four helix bundle protein [Thermoanaerobaculia bacterium]
MTFAEMSTLRFASILPFDETLLTRFAFSTFAVVTCLTFLSYCFMPIATDAAATKTITMPIATFIFVLMLETSPDTKLGSFDGVYGAKPKGFGEGGVTVQCGLRIAECGMNGELGRGMLIDLPASRAHPRDDQAMKVELAERTRRFALRIIAEVDGMNNGPKQWTLGKQLLKSGTAIGAIYREACRAESRADFIHKISMAEKEADETCYWLELLSESGTIDPQRIEPILKEANELLAILVASGRTARSRAGIARN